MFWAVVIAIIAIFTATVYMTVAGADPMVCTKWVPDGKGDYYCKEEGVRGIDTPVPKP